MLRSSLGLDGRPGQPGAQQEGLWVSQATNTLQRTGARGCVTVLPGEATIPSCGSDGDGPPGTGSGSVAAVTWGLTSVAVSFSFLIAKNEAKQINK